MNDKTAIEKALRELLWLIDQGQLVEKEKSMCGPAIVHHAREALAALDAEKPGDDYALCECASDIQSSAYDWGIDYDEIKRIIQSFAAYYHADKCKVCNDFCSRAKEHCEDRESPVV